MTDQMRPQQRLGHSSTRNVHLVISLSKFRFSHFSASSLATKYSAALLGSTVAGELNCCNSQSNNSCFFRTVTATHSNALKSSLAYSNVTKLDIFSSRLDTDWIVQLVKRYADSLESISIICSNEPDGLSKLATETCLCSKVNCLRIEILSSRRFGNLQDRLPRQFANNLTKFCITFPVTTIDLIHWLNGVDSAQLASIGINSVANFELPLLQSNVSEPVRLKITSIPRISAQVGGVLGLNHFPQLKTISIDCATLVQPDSIRPLVTELSSLNQLESIVFTEVKMNFFELNSPLQISPMQSLRSITIRFAHALYYIPNSMLRSHLWSILLPFAHKLVFQNIPKRATNRNEANSNIQIVNFPFVRIIEE